MLVSPELAEVTIGSFPSLPLGDLRDPPPGAPGGPVRLPSGRSRIPTSGSAVLGSAGVFRGPDGKDSGSVIGAKAAGCGHREPAYLDTLANLSSATEKSQLAAFLRRQKVWDILEAPLHRCGQYAHCAECEGGHLIGKVLVCARDWCPTCGQNRSEAHRRRYSRALRKVQQISSLGIVTITWPVEARAGLMTATGLTTAARQAVAVLKDFGFVRGLRRYHWFGEVSDPFCGYAREWVPNPLPAPGGHYTAQFKEWTDGKRSGFICPVCGHQGQWRDVTPVYHPHLMLGVDGGLLPKEHLEAIKDALRAALTPAPWVINYGYAGTPGRILHRLRYITRATFRSWEWEPEVALNLAGFRNLAWWGLGTAKAPSEWNRPDAWALLDLPQDDAEDVEMLLRVYAGVCPVPGCGAALVWTEDIARLDTLAVESNLGHGFLLLRGPPAGSEG